MNISLCIVARNEAFFIRRCIESAAPAVDEIIVVDTGSTDGTQEKARKAGARVIEEPWPGDLGAAHNLPLKYASGDWILVLDGDEALDQGSLSVLCESANGTADGYRTLIRNYIYEVTNAKWRPADARESCTFGAGGYLPTRPVRFFRRNEKHVFRGCLHQSVAPSITENGGVIADSNLLIHHYGFLRIDRQKQPFYARLARQQVENQPDSALAWLEFGVTLMSETGGIVALDAFRKARDLGARAEGSYLMAQVLLEMGYTAASLPLLRDAIRHNPQDESNYLDSADAFEMIGFANEQLSRVRGAERAYRRALKLRSCSPIAGANLAGILLDRRAYKEAEALIAQLKRDYPGNATVWSLEASLLLRRNDIDGARRSLETALLIDPNAVLQQINLAVVYERAGKHRSAAVIYRALAENREARAKYPEISRYLPRTFRAQRKRTLKELGAGGVISMIQTLHGGGGRALVDVVRALQGRPQAVFCRGTGTHTGLNFKKEVESLGVPVFAIEDPDEIRQTLSILKPECVIHHWSGYIKQPIRIGNERWIAYGHSTVPMPAGYDAYVVGSRFQAQFQRHLPANRTHFLPNGIDLKKFRRISRVKKSPVTIVMVSRLDVSKFPRRLLFFLPDLKLLNARLLIAGPGQRRYEIEPELATHGLQDCVQFVGPIPSIRIPHFLTQADIGLHLSETSQEVCSLAMLEMLAAGLPIVAEPKGCLPEMITDSKNGYLAEDEAVIAKRLQQLILSASLRRQMGAESRRKAAFFNMKRFNAGIRKIISDPLPSAVEAPLELLPPEPVRWRPRQSLILCSTSAFDGQLLAASVASTGLAGSAGRYFDFLNHKSFEQNVNDVVSAAFHNGSTPNGVFSALLLDDELDSLISVVQQNSAMLLNNVFPDQKAIVVQGKEPPLLAQLRIPVLKVKTERLKENPIAVAREILKWLQIDIPRPFFPDTSLFRKLRK